jgi:ACR3 family arsenite efflux pump ArsB
MYIKYYIIYLTLLIIHIINSLYTFNNKIKLKNKLNCQEISSFIDTSNNPLLCISYAITLFLSIAVITDNRSLLCLCFNNFFISLFFFENP